MVFGICATKNQYFAVECLIKQIFLTQSNIERIYFFCEGNVSPVNNKITIIDVSKFEPITKNYLNSKTFTYMALTRCYFSSLLPKEDKIIYLDTDLILEKDLTELWEIDLTNYALAAIKDSNIENYPRPFMKQLPFYFNTGVVLFNLKFFREHNLEQKLHELLNNSAWAFPDQDCLNIVCSDSALELDCKFNSCYVTQISPDPYIRHGCWPAKPWEPQSGILFKKWCYYYFKEMKK